jgi:dTDP-4-dehydrorhamnose 3,5-epimerase
MQKTFTQTALPLKGLLRLRRTLNEDPRGSFERLFCNSELNKVLPETFDIAQINRSFTLTRGTVRGLHFQRPPFSEIKLLSCLRGKIFDVTVDVRQNSPTFMQWHGEILDEDFPHSLLIPKGIAHGFQTLSDNCELLYFHSAHWNRAAEGGLNPFDPELAISWPLPPAKISDRDMKHPTLSQLDCKQLLEPVK